MNINTRADLDAIAGTPDHAVFLSCLAATLSYQADTAIYPTNYNRTLASGEAGYVAPNWQAVQDTSVIARFGYTQAEIVALTTASSS